MQGFARLMAGAALAASVLSAHATQVVLAADGQWQSFNVNEIDSVTFGVEWIDNADSLSPDFGSPLSFTFSVAGGSFNRLTVVDAGFAGDTFIVTNQGGLLGQTSGVPMQSYLSAPDVGVDFDAALADTRFSRAVVVLGAGDYVISGALLQSVDFDGSPLNATIGGMKLEVTPIPEPASVALMLAGIGVLGLVGRRRD